MIPQASQVGFAGQALTSSRRMADIFHELPDADEYADYYEAIPEPECLDNICVSTGLTSLSLRVGGCLLSICFPRLFQEA